MQIIDDKEESKNEDKLKDYVGQQQQSIKNDNNSSLLETHLL